MGLFVDDGVPSRGHRSNLVSGKFGVTGNFSGPHKDYGTMTTQDFAGAYTPKETA